MATLPYNAATRTSGTPGAPFTPPVKKKTPLLAAQAAQGSAPPVLGKAAPLFNASNLISNQYDIQEGRLGTQKQEAARSALENAQRGAAINNTTGAGFNTKIQQDAVNDSAKPYLDASAGLASDRAGALAGAGTARDAMKEQQRQFNFSAGLQKYMATNEMDLNKFSTFVNSSTALKESGLDNPEAWVKLMQSGIIPEQLKTYGINSPNISKSSIEAVANQKKVNEDFSRRTSPRGY